jgi:hypothetical protein
MSDINDSGLIDDTRLAEQAKRVIDEVSREADQLLAPDIAPDRARVNTPNFSRMRREWRPGDEAEIAGIVAEANGVIHREFPGIFLILNDIWAIAREPIVNLKTGEIATDAFGWPLWKRLPSGAYAEDYSKLTGREKDDFLLRITMGLLEWRRQADLAHRLPSMLAKGRWEEAMATGFVTPTGRMTVEERTQRGRQYSAQDRYWAIYLAEVSRAADHLVSGMELLGQRLKDSLTA